MDEQAPLASEAISLGPDTKPDARQAVIEVAKGLPLRAHSVDAAQCLLGVVQEALRSFDESERAINLTLGLRC